MAISLALQRPEEDGQTVRPTPALRAIVDDATAPRAGPADADVTIVLFTDYQCAVCRATDPALERLIDRDRRVRVIFKDWPIFGANSVMAARVAMAADRQGKYLALHRALMTSHEPINAATLPAIAARAGVDWAKLAADLAAHGTEIDTALAAHAREARSLGLQGTPGYLVGPYLVRSGLRDGPLKRKVAAARRSAS